MLSNNFFCKLCGSFKTFEKELRWLVCFNRNDEPGKGVGITYPVDFPLQAQSRTFTECDA